MGDKKVYILLFCIVFISAFFRVYRIDKSPSSLSWDEVSHGYNAYSILKTGKDEWGQFLPIANFRAYGDYPLTLNIYLTIPFIAIFGLSEFSIKLPHVILGMLTVFVSYFLALGLTKSKRISLFTSLLVATEPWHFFFSRFVAQSNLSVFFLTASAAAFFNKEKNKYLIPLSVVFLGLTLYSYHKTRIVSPLMLLLAIFVFRKDLGSFLGSTLWIKRITFLFCLLFFLPLPYILANPESRARSSEVFLINEGVVNRIIEKRQSSDYPEIITRLLYNRPVYFVGTAVKNHLGYFSPQFLFFRGGTHYQFSVPGKGLLYPVNILFFYLGLFLIARKVFLKDKNYQFILLWFFVAPISGSITKEPFAVMRATPMLPLPQLFSAIGFFAFLDYLRKKVKVGKSNLINIAWFLYFLMLFLSMESYLVEYFGNYTKNYSQDRQYGYKEVVEYAKENYSKYDKIIVTKKYGEPHEFFLFYWPWDPEEYRSDPNLNRFYQSKWYWVDRFDKFYFVNDWDIPQEEWESFKLESGLQFDCKGDRCLLVTSPGSYPKNWMQLYSVNFLDGKPAFKIYEK